MLKKGVDFDSYCSLCKDGFETVEHAILKCSQAMEVWKILLPAAICWGVVASCWVAPPVGYLKINVDGAWLKSYGGVGLGLVVRDYLG